MNKTDLDYNTKTLSTCHDAPVIQKRITDSDKPFNTLSEDKKASQQYRFFCTECDQITKLYYITAGEVWT